MYENGFAEQLEYNRLKVEWILRYFHRRHHLFVFGVALHRVDYEFMLQLARVGDVKADGFTLVDFH